MGLVQPLGRAPLGAGSLRQRAIRAAHHILEKEGEAGLNLRAIAGEIGAGVGSLYYHFADKDALLAELAADGFRELRRLIAAAVHEPHHRTPFHAGCDAYLHFTRSRPALYALMYNERLLANHDVARRAEAEAFDAFQSSVREFDVSDTYVEDVALTFWVLGRGIAAVSAATNNGYPGAAKEIVRKVLRGLEILTGRSVKTRAARSSRLVHLDIQ